MALTVGVDYRYHSRGTIPPMEAAFLHVPAGEGDNKSALLHFLQAGKMQAQLQHIKVAPNDEIAQMVRHSGGTGAVRSPPRFKDWGWGAGSLKMKDFIRFFCHFNKGCN